MIVRSRRSLLTKMVTRAKSQNMFTKTTTTMMTVITVLTVRECGVIQTDGTLLTDTIRGILSLDIQLTTATTIPTTLDLDMQVLGMVDSV